MTPKKSLPRSSSFGAMKASALGALLCCASAAQALDFGPDGMFSLNGFAEATIGMQTNYCLKCQVADSTVSKQVKAADAIIPGKSVNSVYTTFWQVQPYLGAKYNLGGGYELSALLSQRWRAGTVDGNNVETRYGGTVDIPDYWYEKNVALKHDDYGSVRIGAMTTRGWSVADFPYGGNVGVSESWASSGAGYGMLGNAIRVGSRKLDVAEGDLFVELTYDYGNENFKRLKPEFFELYAQYAKGDLVMDAVYQSASNGGAGAWGHGPFSAVTPFPADDAYVSPTGVRTSENKQSIAMLMARYQVNSKVELSGGIRHNSWSGANWVYNDATKWGSGFNVDYTNPFADPNPGYSATSVDLLLAGRYRSGPWTYFTSMVYLGSADTKNPSERGQSNSAMINTLGAKYDYAPGVQITGTAGMINFAKRGLSPLSMPGNASFGNVDSRIAQTGHWASIGVVYSF